MVNTDNNPSYPGASRRQGELSQRKRLSNRATYFLLGLGFLLIFGLTYRAPVAYTRSDPHLSLFVAQALLQQGTIRLDGYAGKLDPDLDNYAIRERDGHIFYFFPSGSSVFALPFVWTANQMGGDMTVTAHNHQLQKLLASSLCSLIFVLLYLAARHFLEAGAALVITAVTVLGSSLISTMGAAFWNVNVSLLFIALSLWLIARDANRAAPRHPYFLGAFLFAAYFSRPTSASFILPVLVYLAGWRRGSFIRVAATLGLGLLGFVLFSWLAYGRFFPDYYALARFDRSYQVGRVFWGHLFSPSRGWFVFSPFLAFTLIGLLFCLRRLVKRPFFWLCLGWIALHLVAVSHIGHWWGGHSFGPRLLADVVPAAFLLTVLLWQEARKTIGPRVKRTAVAVYLALGLFAIFVNSYQALYNTSTQRWNDYPNVNDYPEYIWDWRYPQFLASPHALEARYQQHLEREAGD